MMYTDAEQKPRIPTAMTELKMLMPERLQLVDLLTRKRWIFKRNRKKTWKLRSSGCTDKKWHILFPLVVWGYLENSFDAQS